MTAAWHRVRTAAQHTLRLCVAVAAAAFTGPALAAPPVLLLQVADAIGPASADYIVRGLARAHEQHAPLVVIELDTPGGLDSSMRRIIQAILASPVPVAVYVAPEGARAASAGTYILYAAHIAAMAPATTLGAATPVAIGLPGSGDTPLGRPPAADAPASAGSAAASPRAGAPGFDAHTAKAVNDAAAFIRGLAQQRGRNAEWAERAVREAVSLTAAEALRDKVIDLVAADREQLLDKIDGRQVTVQGKEVVLHTRGAAVQALLPDWRQQLLAVIANPSFALILMMIGIYGLMFEFMSPGFGVAGVTGAICLLLGLFALQMLPVNYAGLGLLLLGLVLLVAELHAPSGVLGAGGVIAFVAGGVLLFDSDVPGFGVPWWLVGLLGLSSAAVVLLGGGMALRARARPVVAGLDVLAGERGEMLAPDGQTAWALVNGERWKVRSDEALRPGQRLRVVGRNGLVLDVRADAPADDERRERRE